MTWLEQVSSNLLVNELVDYFKTEVKVKHLGELKHFGGMKIERNENGISLSQIPNIDETLQIEQMDQCKTKKTPMQQNLKLEVAEGKAIVNQKKYSSIIGKLMYITRCTRPDITTAVCILSRFSHGPGIEHHQAIKRVLQYLKGSKDWKLKLKGKSKDENNEWTLQVFVDSDWAGPMGKRKSTTGYAIYLNGCLIAWRSVLQKVVALSTCEARISEETYCERS
jgi:hypothetical protein